MNLSQVKYCGGYSGEDPPLPIPNREVKLTSADGTATPSGRVGSCRFSNARLNVFSRAFLLYTNRMDTINPPCQRARRVNLFLVVDFADLEVSLRMAADRTELWSLGADNDVSAVAAFPNLNL